MKTNTPTTYQAAIDACSTGDIRALQSLLDKGVEDDTSTISGSDHDNLPTAAEMLEHAARHNQSEATQYLLDRYPDAPITDGIIWAAIESGSPAVYALIYSRDPVILNRAWNERGSSISFAVIGQHMALVEWLLSHGADPNVGSFGPLSAIAMATSCLPTKGIKLLVEHGARLEGSGALQLAAAAGRLDVTRCLLDLGAPINEVVDRTGLSSALHDAVAKGHADVVKLLLARGADVDLKDKQGRAARDVAKTEGKKDMVALLEK